MQVLEIDREIGEAVRRERKVCGLTLEELAKMSGMSISQLHRIETGKCPVLARRLKAVASALNQPIEVFWGD